MSPTSQITMFGWTTDPAVIAGLIAAFIASVGVVMGHIQFRILRRDSRQDSERDYALRVLERALAMIHTGAPAAVDAGVAYLVSVMEYADFEPQARRLAEATLRSYTEKRTGGRGGGGMR